MEISNDVHTLLTTVALITCADGGGVSVDCAIGADDGTDEGASVISGTLVVPIAVTLVPQLDKVPKIIAPQKMFSKKFMFFISLLSILLADEPSNE